MSSRGAGMSSDQSRSLWDAVDRLVAPTRVKIDRQAAGEWLSELAEQFGGACKVESYRSANVVHATVPSLWDQSTFALYGAGGEPGRGSKPLRERSVADLNLLEIRAQVIEGVRLVQQKIADTGHCEEPPQDRFDAKEVRHVASLVQRHTPDGADLFAFRLTSWTRALETYLQAGEHEVRSVRLRDQPCPTCRTAQVTIDRDGNTIAWNPDEDHHDGDRQVASALVIRFRDGLVQAAQCEACGDSWFRGDALERLAEKLGIGMYSPTGDDERIGA